MNERISKRAKYGERILSELGLILKRDLGDLRFRLVSLTKIELNRDGSVCKVYWDTFESSKRGEIECALGKARGRMRTLLGRILRVRTVPALRLIYDGQFEEEQKISQILQREQNVGKFCS